MIKKEDKTMQKKNNEKGITILVLAITIVILVLITVPIVVNTNEIGELQSYTYFKADIDRLRESIEVAYLNVTDLSSIGTEYTKSMDFLAKTQNGQNVKNPNDGNKYYIINLYNLNKHLDAQIQLNYGRGNKITSEDTTDIYIINEQSRTIYYVKGIEYKEVTYYRLPEEFTEVTSLYTVSYDANGGINAPQMESVEATGNATVTIKSAPTKSGHTFAGWKEEGTNNIFNVGATYTVKKSTRFIAQWN